MQVVHAVSFGIVAAIGLAIAVVAIATVSWVFVIEDVSASLNDTNTSQTKQVGLFQVCTDGSCETDGKYLLLLCVFVLYSNNLFYTLGVPFQKIYLCLALFLHALYLRIGKPILSMPALDYWLDCLSLAGILWV